MVGFGIGIGFLSDVSGTCEMILMILWEDRGIEPEIPLLYTLPNPMNGKTRRNDGMTANGNDYQ